MPRCGGFINPLRRSQASLLLDFQRECVEIVPLHSGGLEIGGGTPGVGVP